MKAILLLVFLAGMCHGQKGGGRKDDPYLEELVSPGIKGSEQSEKYVGNPCTREENCGACVRADPQCAWCSAESFSQETSSHRCDYHGNLITKCDPGQLVYPSHRLEKIVDDELSNKGALEGQAIQIKPQEIKLRLRPGSPFPLQVEFRQAEDYPVDLYYLMDLSKSMEDDKDKLATLGDLLAEHMGNITSNFRLGFGSFVDKVVMPYVSTVPEKLKQPCPGCAAPYGFLNHMPLSDKTKIFSNKVKDARVSGNLDAPEGGFDAIMQAVVCEKQIAWRNNSRRMLLFSSDSGFHFAGDGKLGGIVKPNDGLCHLDNQGYYTESIHQDYPSISQLNHKIQEKKVNIIFAVTASQVPVYERLSARLEASSTGRLENDSSNIVQLVQEQYDKITSSVVLTDNLEDKSYVKVSYYSSCLGDKKEKTQVCKGLKVGTHVKFEAQIEVLRCPEDASKWNQTFIIYPEGLNEGLTVNLEMVCDCPCEKPWAEERNSPKCSDGHGTYECGICSCYNNRYGDNCQCDAKDNDPAIIEASCYKSNDSKPCSGRGSCHCGKCACDNYPVVWGKHCECDDLACDRHDNKMCSGPDHGYCKCGECICLDGWMGEVCDCRNTTDTCYAPGSEQICSGHGYCDCGKCHCFETGEEHFSGEFCEECPTCPGKCELFKECVQCRTFESGPLSEAECNNCSFFPVKTDKLEIKDPDREKLCIFRDDDDCKFMFTYAQDEKNPGIYLVRVQVTKDCPEPINLLAILLGVIVGIVAVGVALLLLWKLLTVIHDRREFAKFEKERENAKWDTGENPIYKQATSTFKNPTYGGKQ